MSAAELVEVIAVDNVLGEGIQWNAVDGCAWWTDIQSRKLYRWHPASATLENFCVPERAGCFALIEGSDELIVAFESGFARYCPATGATHWVARPEQGVTGRRFNDGRADRQGRFWAGTMVENRVAAGDRSASLYCIDHRGQMTRHIGGIEIFNGLCFSPDSRYCYFADSPTRHIFRFVFDVDNGRLGPGEIFAQTPEGGFPDGAAVDCDGCLWSAQWGAGQVIRYTPSGRIDAILPVPTRQPSCVAFGGPDLDLLLVTSAREGLSQASLAAEPLAGNVFVFRTCHTGLTEPRYRQQAEQECANQPRTS